MLHRSEAHIQWLYQLPRRSNFARRRPASATFLSILLYKVSSYALEAHAQGTWVPPFPGKFLVGVGVLTSSRVTTPASTHAQRAAHRSPAEFSHPVTQLGGSDGRNRTAAPAFELLSKALAS